MTERPTGSPGADAAAGRARVLSKIAAFDLRAVATAILLGAAGGAVFWWLALPLAWMLGSMTATSAAAIGALKVSIPRHLRSVMMVVLGVLMGSAFHPEILTRIEVWTITLASLVPYIFCCILLGGLYLRRVARYDPVTAYFTAAPGGLVELSLAGRQYGGDDRVIALSHSIRIMLTVFAIPIWLALSGELAPGARSAAAAGAGQTLDLVDGLLMAACAIGAPIAAWLRFPAYALAGPMVLSGALHITGIVSGSPPADLVNVAQIVVGASIGCRFVGISLARLFSAGVVAVGLTALLMAIDVAFSLFLAAVTGIGFVDLILAFAPGGTVEMSVVALAIHADTAFVSTHHVARIILVVLLVPLAFRLAPRLFGAPGAQPR